MKLNKLYIACGVLFLGAATLTGCSDDEAYDVDGSNNNLIYIDQSVAKVTECTVYHTPVGSYGDITANVKTKLQYASADSITISAAPDTSMVSVYNKEYHGAATTVPADVLAAIQLEKTGVAAGANVASEPLRVTIPAEACARLSEPEYVVPLRLSAVKEGTLDTDRPVVASEEMGVYYLAIHTTHDMVYLSGSNSAKCAIVRTPVGVFGEVKADYNVGLHFQLDSEVKVSATVDNSLIDAYNAEHNKNYKALPANVAGAIEVTAATVAAGEVNGSLHVALPTDLGRTLTEAGYVAPLRLVAEYANGTKVTLDSQVAYLVVTTEESLIQDEPTAMLGTAVSDISAWKCISAVNYNKDELTLSTWKFSQMNIDNASFVVDFGAVHKVGAFKLSCSPGKSFRFYLSEDNANWVDLGDVNGKDTYYEDWSNQWYVLYGAVKARYVKVEQTLDSSHWGWSYGNYSWGASYVSTTWGLTFAD